MPKISAYLITAGCLAMISCSQPEAPAVVAVSPPPSTTPVIPAPPPPPAAEPSVQAVAPPPPPPLLRSDQYNIRVKPTLVGGDSVRIDVTTNIPGTIEVMAAVSLAGQKPDDPYVGKDERLRITDGSGSTAISVSDLPKGSYDAEVDFYPAWGFQDSASRATRIDSNIHASARLRLKGTGEAAEATVTRKQGQKWVAEHLAMGDPWREADLVSRFGRYEELQVDRFNPEIIKAYYFPRIDVTIFANVLKGEISHWRFGRASS